MIQRCTNDKTPNWDDYGGRGIQVCERWLVSFENFLADVGPRPTGKAGARAKYSLDRFPNNNGNYEPGNVRWATCVEQNNNQRPKPPRDNGKANVNGESCSIQEACRRLGLHYATIIARVRRGMPVGEALARPIQKKGLRKAALD